MRWPHHVKTGDQPRLNGKLRGCLIWGSDGFPLAVSLGSPREACGAGSLTVTEDDHAGGVALRNGEGQQPIRQSETSLPCSGSTDSRTVSGWNAPREGRLIAIEKDGWGESLDLDRPTAAA